MRKDDQVRLHHMLDAANEALSFISDKSRSRLNADRMLVLSLIKDIEIIGEAAGKVSNELRTKHPGIPWLDIIDMRNHLILFKNFSNCFPPQFNEVGAPS